MYVDMDPEDLQRGFVMKSLIRFVLGLAIVSVGIGVEHMMPASPDGSATQPHDADTNPH